MSDRRGTFTPIFDDLRAEKGLIVASVFGAVWRFSQMRGGVCMAALGKIADRAGVDRRTVIRVLKALISDGYLIDLTPNITYRPHVYRVVNTQYKVDDFEGVTDSHSHDLEMEGEGVTVDHSPVIQGHSQESPPVTGTGDSESPKDTALTDPSNTVLEEMGPLADFFSPEIVKMREDLAAKVNTSNQNSGFFRRPK